ncbi:unnamed protein product, partial [Brassica oleracea var. botrytis]
RSNPYFRFGEIHVSIRFRKQTVFVEVAETDSSGEFWVLQLRTSYALQAAFSSMQPPEHISTFTKKVFCGSDIGSSSTPSKYGGVQKIELATIVEFIVCVVNSPPQVCGTIEFHCTGQVDDSEKTDGPMLHHQSFAYKEVVTTLEMIFWML